MVKRRGGAAFAIAGLFAFAATVIWFGMVAPQRRGESTAGAPPAGLPEIASPAGKNKDATASVPGGTHEPQGKSSANPANSAAREAGPREPAAAALSPTFDVVRVEPNGESVLAGRGAPGAAIEMLRNGELHARVMADASGLFALVPPPMPPGSSEIILQSIAPDGARSRSRDSVTVEIAPDLKAKPLVALTAPDKPTVVLSGPDRTETASVAPPPAAAPSSTPPAPAQAPSVRPSPGAPPQAPAPRPGVRVESVETQGEGRLFVSGRAAPGATVRLYLNDSLVAPGAAAPDGRLSFMIEKGVRPGGYAVRLDDVDPVSGEVKSRAEVEFAMPPSAVLAERAPPMPPVLAERVPRPDPPAAAQRSPWPLQVEPRMQAAAPRSPEPPAAAPAKAPDAAPSGSSPSLSSGGEAPRRVASAPAVAPSSASDMPAMVIVPEINTAIVARGDNLWRISRRVYGQGIRYTVIYGANQPQIRNPSRIYPGQVFVLPADQASPQ